MSQGVECYSCLPKTAWPPTCASNARSETYNLDLLYAVVSGAEPKYDNAEHFNLNTSLRIWMGKGKNNAITVYVLSCYINTGDVDTRRHEQKVELVTPTGTK